MKITTFCTYTTKLDAKRHEKGKCAVDTYPSIQSNRLSYSLLVCKALRKGYHIYYKYTLLLYNFSQDHFPNFVFSWSFPFLSNKPRSVLNFFTFFSFGLANCCFLKIAHMHHKSLEHTFPIVGETCLTPPYHRMLTSQIEWNVSHQHDE